MSYGRSKGKQDKKKPEKADIRSAGTGGVPPTEGRWGRRNHLL